jgi:hypothetical protein
MIPQPYENNWKSIQMGKLLMDDPFRTPDFFGVWFSLMESAEPEPRFKS